MKVGLVIIAIAVIIVAAVAILALSYYSPNRKSLSPSSTTSIQSSLNNATETLFNSTNYAQFSYLIYPGNMSQQAAQAMDGYSMASNASNVSNSSEITLENLGSKSNITITLSNSYKLYKVDTSFGDDTPNFDSSRVDDSFIIVNPKGYVVKVFYVN